MDTWVKDVIGLTLAADSVMVIVGFIGAWFYEASKPATDREYIYKNYNYNYTDDKEVKAE